MTLSSLRAAFNGCVVKLSMALLLMNVCPAFLGADEIPPRSPAIEVTVYNNLISAEIIDAPLVDVLKAVEEKAGFKIHLSGDLDDQLTMSLTNVPLDKGLKRLVGKHSLSLLYGQKPSTPDKEAIKNITEVWVYSRRTSGKSPYPKPPEQATFFAENSAEVIPPGPEPSPALAGNDQEGFPPESQSAEQQPDSANRQPSLAELVERGDAASVMAMVEFLGDEDKEVRRRAVNGIGSVQGDEATQALGQVVSGEPDPEIRMMAVRALAQRQDDTAAHAFLTEALNDPDEKVQQLASQLLNQ